MEGGWSYYPQYESFYNEDDVSFLNTYFIGQNYTSVYVSDVS